ncbi:MAG: thiol reductant ABC exporter subunit CydC [Bacillota bacterium]|nr:thiol reductant ABC exporter subunit CydC [Bacillota bacterium]
MDGVLRRWLGFLRPLRRRVSLGLLLGLLTVGSNVGLLAVSGYLISASALRPSTILLLWVPIVGVRFFGIARGVFRYLERLVTHDATFRLLAELRVTFYRALAPLAPAGLGGIRRGDLLSRMVQDVETLQNLFLRLLYPPAVAALTLLLGWAILAPRGLALALAFSLFYLLAGAVLPALSHRLARQEAEALPAARAELTTLGVDAVHGMTELVAFSQEGAWTRRLAAASARLIRHQRGLRRAEALTGALLGLSQNLAMAAVLLLAVPRVRAGHLPGPEVAAVALAALAAFEAVMPLPAALAGLGESVQASRRLEELERTPPPVPEPPLPPLTSGPVSASPSAAPAEQVEPVAAGPVRLEVRGLRYTYPGAERPALADLDLSLAPGARVALVGPSGSGKSTLLDLLVRFRDPEAGEILLDGRPTRGMEPALVRSFFSVVAQESHLFHASLGENLRLGRPGAGEAELRGALRVAQLEEWWAGLPEGMATQVGEAGLRLSGGERRRVAVARALLRPAPILLLDEPAGGLDALTEQRLMEALLAHLGERSLLLVTHRLAGLEAMDEIVVLHRGRVVERGRHRQLLARRGLYRRMWELEQELLVEEPALLEAPPQRG